MDAFATEIRVGNVIKVDGKLSKVISQEIRGTGKFGKTIHLRLKHVEDGNMQEKSIRAEDKVETVEVRREKMQYLYREGDQFHFMSMTSYEQHAIPSKSIGRQEIFLKENSEIDVCFAEERPVSIDFPKIAELKVVGCAPGVKGGGDSTYKEVELENGLKILAPQFIKEGDSVRVNVDDLSYAERVTLKSMKEN